jgi:hypothetical protein
MSKYLMDERCCMCCCDVMYKYTVITVFELLMSVSVTEGSGRLKNDIKTEIKDIGWEGLDWTYLTQNRAQ